jgi:hypothetical protein
MPAHSRPGGSPPAADEAANLIARGLTSFSTHDDSRLNELEFSVTAGQGDVHVFLTASGRLVDVVFEPGSLLRYDHRHLANLLVAAIDRGRGVAFAALRHFASGDGRAID